MDNYYDHISDYLKGKMSDSDQEEFKRALSRDKDLAEAVEHYDIIELISDELVERDIQESIDEVKFVSTHKKVGGRKHLPLLSIAASTIVLIGLGYLLLRSSNLTQTIYDENYNPLIVSTERGDNNFSEISEMSICDAAQELQQNVATHKESIAKYQEALAIGDTDCKAEAEWNLILLHLLNKDYESLQPIMDKIIHKESHPYHNHALNINKDWRFKLSKYF